MTDDDLRGQRLLDALDLPDQASRILERPEYRTVAFCRRYLDRCEALRHRDPVAGLRTARVATTLAQRVPKQECDGVRGWCSLQVRALVAAAEAQRSVSDLAAADATCRVASFLFADDADQLARADLLRLLAGLRRDQRRFEEAERYADALVAICEELQQPHLQGCALVDRGVLLLATDRPWKAAGDLFEAMALIDRVQSPRYFYSAAHHLALALADDHEANPIEALYWLRYAQRLNRQPESSLSQLKLLWAEGRILEKQGMLTEAEHYMQTVRQRLLEDRTLGDYALASLDLAGIYLKQARPREVRMLAGELFPVFDRLRGDPDALDGLKRFHRAAIAEALSFGVLRSVKGILKSRIRPTI